MVSQLSIDTASTAVNTTVVEVDHLTVGFGEGHTAVRPVDDVSLEVRKGDCFALVGESGCGKSTLAYSLLNMVTPPGRVERGRVLVAGRDVLRMKRRELDSVRGTEIALVFQAAMNAFNPVVTIGHQVEHILEAHDGVFSDRAEGRAYFEHLLEMVLLPPQRIWDTYESRLSGGMKQRVAIAVSLLLKPSVLVLDEPTTALDVLNQRLVIAALRGLYESLGLTIIFITHDMAVVAELASRVGVMYAGRMVEVGGVDDAFFHERRHPYVKALVSAIPSVVAEPGHTATIPGHVPDLHNLPPGCRFAPRCPLVQPRCHEAEPSLVADSSGHAVSCFVVNEAPQSDVEAVS
jgi:peptide/nickel transport system ATP-binding protein